ncbi:MAG: lytic transglycosylase domain-containing protein, partial [Alistipes onderdonkii]
MRRSSPPLPDVLGSPGARSLENFDTRESCCANWRRICIHSRTMQTLLSVTRYFPVIEPIMEKYGIPDDFKYLCMAESGLVPEARSGAGAAGLWQLMAPTAKDAGLFVVTGLDERYHIEKATQAACKFLLDAKNRLGSWTLAAAAYNAGVAGVNRRVQTQGVDSYYDLYLPEETMR